MQSNSKEVKEKIKLHILDCVTLDGNEFETIEKACLYMYDEFVRVANYPANKARIPNDQLRFSDHLYGIPYNFHFYYNDVKTFLESLEINNTSGTDYDLDDMLKFYHYLIYNCMIKVVNKNRKII
jgi:hypothetical protein